MTTIDRETHKWLSDWGGSDIWRQRGANAYADRVFVAVLQQSAILVPSNCGYGYPTRVTPQVHIVAIDWVSVEFGEKGIHLEASDVGLDLPWFLWKRTTRQSFHACYITSVAIQSHITVYLYKLETFGVFWLIHIYHWPQSKHKLRLSSYQKQCIASRSWLYSYIKQMANDEYLANSIGDNCLLHMRDVIEVGVCRGFKWFD